MATNTQTSMNEFESRIGDVTVHGRAHSLSA